ncbi:TDT family transporter [Streptacidiphilus jiangxiensis]|uniref:Tellurite resistance protein TehA n=1 Tax=Streptacidiphilus jiangxiensis TaxID=235985 RepID=A0A1H7JLU8_STRJI|nr:TDT family transporter [Streptacidiphilus jiangxiensis]SEK74837.1 Tellurite resistance protein TehA [Streptacidiphilus jiangxiensis]
MATTALSRPLTRRLTDHPVIEAAGRFGPNWYAAVMGTAIVANGAHALPGLSGVLGVWAELFWALGFAGLLLLAGVRLVGRLHRARVRPLADPSVAVFLGCPPMALMAVGFGALGAGEPLLGPGPAVALDAVLWTLGTCYGLWAAGTVMFKLALHYEVARSDSAPTWLLPVVAPMVSAALGPALIPHLPAGQAQQTLLLACVAMFGMSLIAVLMLLPTLFARLAHEGPLPQALIPTLFLVLGPLGQSVTAVTQFAAHGSAAGLSGGAFGGFALLYGVPVFGFALLWLAVAGAATVRGLRRGMPFAMTWWAYTFPVGTCVTGAAGLYARTGLDVFAVASVALYVLLVTAWTVVAVRTVRWVPKFVRA